MRKLSSILLLLILLLVVQDIYGQRWKRYRREAYVGFVTSSFLGELGGANSYGTNSIKDFDAPAIKAGTAYGYYYRLSNVSAIEGKFAWFWLSGDDKYTQEVFRNNRNLSFRSTVLELSTQYDFFLHNRQRGGGRYGLRGIRGRKQMEYTIYAFVGLGGFRFDPKAKDEKGEYVRLQPLSTEGQGLVPTRKPYSLYQFEIPFGVGIRYIINKELTLVFEYGYRRSFTDYIDDVSTTYFDLTELEKQKGPQAVYFSNRSPKEGGIPGSSVAGQQRGDPRDKDAFMLAFVTLSYKLPKRGFAVPKF